MALISRRRFIQLAAGTGLAGFMLAGDALAVEPAFMLDVTRYTVKVRGWPRGLRLKIVAIADIHACDPLMSEARVRSIANLANSLNPDLIVLLGDFNAGHDYVTGAVFPEQWGRALSVLKAPLGAWGVLGNHDWWHGPLPDMPGDEGAGVRRGMRLAGIEVMENRAVRLNHQGQPFWLLGLGDQMAHLIQRGWTKGIDDLPGTLAQVKDQAPAILLAHEPYVFRRVPRRIGLTLCGHTHGGQVNLPFLHRKWWKDGLTGYDSIYGHTEIDDRHMIISGGLGESFLPIRFLRPPEINEIWVEGA